MRVVCQQLGFAGAQAAQFFDHLHDEQGDRCWCSPCMAARGETDGKYRRGQRDAKGRDVYVPPVGWCRFGLKLPARAGPLKVLEDYHVGFHGTALLSARPILVNGRLAMAGETVLGGTTIGIRDGHIPSPFWRDTRRGHRLCSCPMPGCTAGRRCTGASPCPVASGAAVPAGFELFDPNQVFLSPSMRYCAYGEVYAKSH